LALPNVSVRVFGRNLVDTRAALSDEDGRYEVQNLPTGGFQVIAAKTGYVSLAYGAQRPGAIGKPVDVARGEVVSDIDFNLTRGGVLSGRLTDALGEPLSEVQVAAWRATGGICRHQVAMAPGDSTDDTGRFRISGLPAGEYCIAASGSGVFGGIDATHSYVRTYYPGTSSMHEAKLCGSPPAPRMPRSTIR